MVTDGGAKRDVWTFLTLLLLLSSIFYALVVSTSDAPEQWGRYVLPFMWCPGLTALITKLARDKTLRGLGWGWGRTRYFLIAYGLAIVGCLLPYMLVWVPFDAFSRSQFDEALAKADLPSALHSPTGLLLVVLVVSPLTGLLSATGEEIGWRGFLVPRMHGLVGFTGTSLLVGFIWAAWHYPINVAVSPPYRPNVPLWYSNTCFTVAVIGVSFMHTWLRLRSESLWPSALMHAQIGCGDKNDVLPNEGMKLTRPGHREGIWHSRSSIIELGFAAHRQRSTEDRRWALASVAIACRTVRGEVTGHGS